MYSRSIAAGLLALVAFCPVVAGAFETQARSALVVDHASGMVLFEKDADRPMPPASMSKLMTLYMLFDAIRAGRVTEDTLFDVSAKAQAMGGSRMFVEAGTKVPVSALIRGIIVQSGNDACVVVAEGLSGSEAAFAEAMTRRAGELGLTGTTLKNASGWPEDGHLMTTADLVALSQHLITEFPEFYEYFKETEYTWNGITQPNRNPLLGLGIGVDGLKTGHTAEAGYGLVGSAVRDGQRIVFVVTGLSSVAERRAETESLVKWAFGAFQTVKFLEAGAVATEAPVWLGAMPTVPLVAPADLQVLVSPEARPGLAARVVYDGPIEAPITAGQPLGALVVDVPGHDRVRFDLVAGRDVARGGILTRISAAAQLTRQRAVGFLPGSD